MSAGDRSVLILMTTYNGERFLREQLDSILGQSYGNFRLAISDDGSTDGTERILSEYSARDGRVILRKNDGPHGAYANFHGLINAMRGGPLFDYYMFADHDDVWLPGKIGYFVSQMEAYPKERPVLLYADMRIIDEDGRITAASLDEKFGLSLPGRYSCFYQHSVFGCNTIMNRSLFMSVPPVRPDDGAISIISHDNYFAKYAALFGTLAFLPVVTMSYRRYASNVTAANHMSITPGRILRRMLDLDGLSRDHARTYLQSLYALERFWPKLPESERKTAEKIARSLDRGGLTGLFIFIRLEVRCGKKLRTLSRALILLAGRYRKYMKTEAFL